jgi:poly-D-alanine transfer protein DltD
MTTTINGSSPSITFSDGSLAKRFNEAFEYKDGELYWKINPNNSKKHIGKLAGYKKESTEYGVVMLDKKSYCLHKVIFCMHHGWMPEVVDHINLVRKDHRIENLRAATHVTNNWNKGVQRNNKLGIKNVCYNKQNKKYWVQITQNRKNIYSQMFDDLELAELVATMAREKYHGEFANHGELRCQ